VGVFGAMYTPLSDFGNQGCGTTGGNCACSSKKGHGGWGKAICGSKTSGCSTIASISGRKGGIANRKKNLPPKTRGRLILRNRPEEVLFAIPVANRHNRQCLKRTATRKEKRQPCDDPIAAPKRQKNATMGGKANKYRYEKGGIS